MTLRRLDRLLWRWGVVTAADVEELSMMKNKCNEKSNTDKEAEYFTEFRNE